MITWLWVLFGDGFYIETWWGGLLPIALGLAVHLLVLRVSVGFPVRIF